MFIPAGQTVGFTYTKGSKPGSVRIVKVLESDNSYIKGNDIELPEGDQYRNFLFSEMQNRYVQVLAKENEEVIPASQLISRDISYLDASQVKVLFELLEPNKKFVAYFKNFAAFVVEREDVPRVELHLTEDKVTVTFVNKKGFTVGLSFMNQQKETSVSLPYRRDCLISESDMGSFATSLAAHIDGASSPNNITTVKGWDEHVAKQKAAGNKLYTSSV